MLSVSPDASIKNPLRFSEHQCELSWFSNQVAVTTKDDKFDAHEAQHDRLFWVASATSSLCDSSKERTMYDSWQELRIGNDYPMGINR